MIPHLAAVSGIEGAVAHWQRGEPFGKLTEHQTSKRTNQNPAALLYFEVPHFCFLEESGQVHSFQSPQSEFQDDWAN
jgi:hypothetical protein